MCPGAWEDLVFSHAPSRCPDRAIARAAPPRPVPSAAGRSPCTSAPLALDRQLRRGARSAVHGHVAGLSGEIDDGRSELLARTGCTSGAIRPARSWPDRASAPSPDTGGEPAAPVECMPMSSPVPGHVGDAFDADRLDERFVRSPYAEESPSTSRPMRRNRSLSAAQYAGSARERTPSDAAVITGAVFAHHDRPSSRT